MNLNQPYEIGLNYVNLNGGGPFVLGPDLHTWPKRSGPSGNYGGGLVQTGTSGTQFTASLASLWGCMTSAYNTNIIVPTGTQGPPVLNAGILTWAPGSANAGTVQYFTYTVATRVFLLTPSGNTPNTGDMFTITTVYGQVRWRLKQMSIEYVSGTLTSFSITDTKASSQIMSGGAMAAGAPPIIMGPTDANNGLCETLNFGYGMTMTLSGTTPAINGSAAVEACGPLWASGDNLN